jgi:hypothetical protein
MPTGASGGQPPEPQSKGSAAARRRKDVAGESRSRYARSPEGPMAYEMLFPAREIKPYGEPVETDQLKVGEIYFGVQFLDKDCFIPIFEPKVFIGRDLEPEDQDKFYFQDYDSYRNGVRYGDDAPEMDSDDARVRRWMGWRIETGAEKHTFTYENALNVLLQCSLRRAKAGK